MEKKIILKEITMLKKNLTKKNVQTYVGKRIILKEITMFRKNLTKKTLLAVGPRKNSKN